MEIKAISGKLSKIQVDAIIIGYFEGMENLTATISGIDKALNGVITELITQKEIKGKVNEVNIIRTLNKLPASRVAIVGLGKRNNLTPEKVRTATAAVLRQLRKQGALDIATAALGMDIAGISSEQSAWAIAEGAILGLYSYRKHMTGDPDYEEVKQLTIIEANEAKLDGLKAGIHKGEITAEACILTRDMVNEPSNYMTPSSMAATAKNLAEAYGLKINILEREQMQELKMGALLGVSQGSDRPPKFITLRYHGKESEKIDVALVGKGITFDSGGISIKPSDGMGEMKGDMAGGASVMSAISAIARLKEEINVIAVIPATENMPSGSAFKPGDILTSMNGKTIEIISTDAEGRLILADALAYTKTFDVKYIIDVATLTGACHIALGDVCTGVFTNNQKLADKIVAAGNNTGEPMWQMPMFDVYKELNKSDVADIKNTGGRWGGAITAAKFLGEFVGETPWAHLDIAGTSTLEKDRGYFLRGATGIPTRTLISFILSLVKKTGK
ncbi:MAG: leucyl aminopeptidase [Dehalococcoidales bacterium]|nr:leucyl aminopeptidase [Dehalococcoidales bacterium]